MQPRDPRNDSTASADRSAQTPAGASDTETAMPDVVVVETVTVISSAMPATDPGAPGAAVATAEAAPLRPEDVHARPPDRLPDGTPEAENVEIIFERS